MKKKEVAHEKLKDTELDGGGKDWGEDTKVTELICG